MKFSLLIKNIIYSVVTNGDAEVCHITKDPADVAEGSLYICIKGISGDGHEHIETAVKNGAVAILCEAELENRPQLPCVKVENSREALGFVCKEFYGDPLSGINVVGVTGTNGKTSTTYFLEGIYKTAGRKCGVIGTAGVRINGEERRFKYATSTTPDTIDLFRIFTAMRNEGVSDIFMEATSHALALHKLSALHFSHALFTNLTQDHLDFHKTFEEYLAAKSRLFKLSDSAVLNADDKSSSVISKDSLCERFTYSVEAESDFRAENLKFSPDGTDFDLNGEHFFLPIPGSFSVYNALAAIASAKKAGIPYNVIAEGLLSVRVIPGRIQPVKNDLEIGVIVDYAHTPDGLEKVIKAVRSFTEKRVITVFGCGGDRDRTKRPIMGRVSGELSDFCVVTSDNPRSEEPESIIAEILPGIAPTCCRYISEPDRRLAIFKALEIAESGDCVIIAGKGHEDYQEYENKRRISFDDRIVAKEALAAKGATL